MQITEFAFIIYPAADLARTRAFYEGVLGLQSALTEVNGDQFYIEYEIGPHVLSVGNEPFLKPASDGPQVVLEVDDFEEAIEHLRRHHVPFAMEPFTMPNCRAAMIFDPAGNKLGIHKRNPR